MLSAGIATGLIVEFLQGNTVHMGVVLEAASGRARLYTQTRRESVLPENRLLPWHGPKVADASSREAMLHSLELHAAKRRDLAAGISAMDVWELAGGEIERADTEFFASLHFDRPGPDETAAMGRALLAAKSHFKFDPPRFVVFDAATVEKRAVEAAAAAEREAVVVAGGAFLKLLWSKAAQAKGAPRPDAEIAAAAAKLDPGAADKLAAMLRALVADDGSVHWAELWGQLRKSLPDYPQQPLLLAQAWGILPPHHNALLDQVGYDGGDDWSAPLEADIEAQIKAADHARLPADDTPFVSIDGASTRDIDDAFHAVEQPDGGVLVSIALALPTLGYAFGSELDRAVARRATSLYLPEATYHMLPERLGLHHFSLSAGQPRPALVARCRIDQEGGFNQVEASLARIHVAANLTYDAAEDDLAAQSPNPVLAAAHTAATRLRARRLARGAVVVERPDLKVGISGDPAEGVVEIRQSRATPAAQLLVSELMILVNQALAAFGQRHGITLFYRNQEGGIEPGLAGVWSGPVETFQVVKKLPCVSLSLSPGRHGGLAVEGYASLSSPLRRYVDFVNMAQLAHFLQHGQPRFDHAAMVANFPAVSSRADSVSTVQRYRPRYWKLVWLRSQTARRHAAVVVEESPHFFVLALPHLQITVRAPRNLLGERGAVGERFDLKLGKIDPLTGEIKVLEALHGADDLDENLFPESL